MAMARFYVRILKQIALYRAIRCNTKSSLGNCRDSAQFSPRLIAIRSKIIAFQVAPMTIQRAIRQCIKLYLLWLVRGGQRETDKVYCTKTSKGDLIIEPDYLFHGCSTWEEV